MESELREPSIKVIVAYTSYPWDHALVNLRFAHPIEYAGLQLIRGNEFGNIHPERVSEADAVLLQREFPGKSGDNYAEIVKRARSEKKPIIYEIDDLLLELPDEHPDRTINYYTPAVFPMLRAILEADIVTTTTPALQTYLRSFNPNTIVLPNYLDNTVWKPRLINKTQDGSSLVLGYMGSTTHSPDLEMISSILITLIEKYQDQINFKFWGAEPPTAIKNFSNVEWIPLELAKYTEFAKFFSQQKCDIAIAPLVDSFFNECKSPVKFFEYSILGIPGVYSRIAPYQSVIHHGENGLLASTLDEWEANIIQLIEDSEYRIDIGQAAQRSVQERWLLSKHAQEWVQAYQQAWAISRDEKARNEKDEYTQVYIHFSSQVHGWFVQQNKKLARQKREIQALHTQLNTYSKPLTATKNLIAKIAKRVKRLLSQTHQN